MDDNKLYTKNKRDIDLLIHMTRIYSEDIGMREESDTDRWLRTTSGPHSRYTDQLQVPWYPTVAWEPWRGGKEDSNFKVPPEGPEKLAQWEEQDHDH